METIRANWYDYPHLYDIAFGWDPSDELDFLEEAFRRFARRPVRSVFEPFCGTGRIAIGLAGRGYRVSGLDINEAAVRYAHQRCEQFGVALDLAVGDVCDWVPSEPVDAVVTLIDSFRHLYTAEAAATALRRFHAGIAPGGVLIVGLDVGEKPAHVDEEQHWTAQRDGTNVETLVFDLRKPGRTPGTSIVRSVLHVTEPDGRKYKVLTDHEFRLYTLASFKQLAREHGPFELVAVHDLHYDFERPVTSPDPSDSIVAVFTRS